MEDPGKSGWISPGYIVSREVGLDPGRVARNRCVALDLSAPEIESYRMIRTKILHNTGERGGTAIMITSAVPGEGKTLTAINLAFTFAKAFSHTVLLVDADLRQQKIQEYLGYYHDKGLVDYLLDGCPVSDLTVWPGVEKLTLISGGRTIAQSSELLGSPGMKVLVGEMKNRYPDRYVFFDVPPVLTAADALTLSPFLDYIVLVVRAGATPVPDVQKALRMLPREKVLGIVLNRYEKAKAPGRRGRG